MRKINHESDKIKMNVPLFILLFIYNFVPFLGCLFLPLHLSFYINISKNLIFFNTSKTYLTQYQYNFELCMRTKWKKY